MQDKFLKSVENDVVIQMIGDYPEYLNKEKAALQQRFLHKVKSVKEFREKTGFDEKILSSELDYHTFEWYGGCEDERNNFFVLGTGHRDYYKKRDQLFNSYGHLAGADLMKRYGFTLRNNKYDNFKIRVTGVNPATGQYE